MDKNLPVLVPVTVLSAQSPTLTTALGAALGAATGRAAQASVLSALVAEDLLRHLHLKLHDRGKVARRARHALGRVANALMGSEPSYVQMTGRHIAQTLKLVGVPDEGAIDARQTYLLRADVARQAHDILGAQLGVDPDTLRKGL